MEFRLGARLPNFVGGTDKQGLGCLVRPRLARLRRPR
jgi:hypothetical protein